MRHHLTCDPDTGTCLVPDGSAAPLRDHLPRDPASPSHAQPHHAPPVVTLHLFTDPICSACWVMEPALRRLSAHTRGRLQMTHHTGGLLRSWAHFTAGPIQGPEEVAHHWEAMGAHFGMPLTGAVWRTDPLDSSDRPSVAVHAAEAQGAGERFLRRLREQLFLEGHNIARADVLHEAARHAGLDADHLLAQVEDPHSEGWARFEDDLRLARTLGVTGFPTFVFRARSAMRAITGVRPWHELAAVVDALASGATGSTPGTTPGARTPDAGRAPAATSVDALLAHHDSWTAPEAALFLDLPRDTATRLLDDAVGTGRLARHDTRAGTLWRRR